MPSNFSWVAEPPTSRLVASDGDNGSVGRGLFSAQGGGDWFGAGHGREGGGYGDDVGEHEGDWKAAWSRRLARGPIHSEYQDSFPWPSSAVLAAEVAADFSGVSGRGGGGHGRGQVTSNFAAAPAVPPPQRGLGLPSRGRESRGKRRGGDGVKEGDADSLRRSGSATGGGGGRGADAVVMAPVAVTTEGAEGLELGRDVGRESTAHAEGAKPGVNGAPLSSEPLLPPWQVVEHVEGVGDEGRRGEGEGGGAWQSRAADAGSSLRGASFAEGGGVEVSGWERAGRRRGGTMSGGRTLDYSSQVGGSTKLLCWWCQGNFVGSVVLVYLRCFVGGVLVSWMLTTTVVVRFRSWSNE